MPVENLDTLRNTALLAGVRLERLVRSASMRDVQRPMLAWIGLIAAGIVVALIHFGADVRAGVAGGQSGLLPSLVQAVSGEQAELAILRSERGDEA
jgi:hypothetical protein